METNNSNPYLAGSMLIYWKIVLGSILFLENEHDSAWPKKCSEAPTVSNLRAHVRKCFYSSQRLNTKPSHGQSWIACNILLFFNCLIFISYPNLHNSGTTCRLGRVYKRNKPSSNSRRQFSTNLPFTNDFPTIKSSVEKGFPSYLVGKR